MLWEAQRITDPSQEMAHFHPLVVYWCQSKDSQTIFPGINKPGKFTGARLSHKFLACFQVWSHLSLTLPRQHSGIWPMVVIPNDKLVLVTLLFWKRKRAEKYGHTLYYQNLTSGAGSGPWFILFTAVDMAPLPSVIIGLHTEKDIQ